jgi:hypothetical protein
MEIKMRSCFVGMLATLSTIALVAPAQAQNSAIDGTLANSHSTTRQKQQRPQTRQQSPTRSTASTTRPRQLAAPSVSDAVATQPTRSRDNPRETSPLDPVALDQNLRLGLETSSRVNTYQFEDGRRIPGLENTTRNEPSYFGLSVSVPTRGNILLPPLLPRPE